MLTRAYEGRGTMFFFHEFQESNSGHQACMANIVVPTKLLCCLHIQYFYNNQDLPSNNFYMGSNSVRC